MSLAKWAQEKPDAPAIIFGKEGVNLSFRELDDRSSALASWMQAQGLQAGDHVAIMMKNDPMFLVVAWAAKRCGLCYTPVNWHLVEAESSYIINDCSAKCVFLSRCLYSEKLASLLPNIETLVVHGDHLSVGEYDIDSILSEYAGRRAEESADGTAMLYSSGTTGTPKGIMPKPNGLKFGEYNHLESMISALYGIGGNSIYLCPAPLYHAAPLGWCMGVTQLGGTIVLMEKFDAEESLSLIDNHRVTHAQFVPTMFIRMLNLDDDKKLRHDLSSLVSIIHAAAPCPVEVKKKMIDWFGPIIDEYYAGSENAGFASINSHEWLTHQGSVGRSMAGEVHVLSESGDQLAVGEVGQIFFESDNQFSYYNDEQKTLDAYSKEGWISYGDIGYVDSDGYIYLVDRVSNMIVSGGVNIYPQEVENLLALHPLIFDVAVIGVRNADFGEEVKAVVVPKDIADIDDRFSEKIIAYCRENLSHFKCPRSVDIVDSLPRMPNGKLLKRMLIEKYQ